MNKQLSFKYYHIFITTIVAIQLMCFILVKRQISIFGITTTASGILFPLDIYLFELIGYCYGFEYSRQAIWINTFFHFVFFTVIQICNILPYGTEMKPEYIHAYHTLFHYSIWIIVGSLIGEFCGEYFSSSIVPRFKVIFESQYTKTILFITHIISELITISISYTITNLPDGYTVLQIAKLVLGTILIKTIVAILLLPIAQKMIHIVRKSEGFDIYDYNQNYSLFKFNPDLRKIRMVNYKGTNNVKKTFTD